MAMNSRLLLISGLVIVGVLLLLLVAVGIGAKAYGGVDEFFQVMGVTFE
jgi:hypothetical protein